MGRDTYYAEKLSHIQESINRFQSTQLNIWLRLFCIALFWACPGQLLVYAMCKEGYPENRENKIALVSPAMENEVCKKRTVLLKQVVIFS